MCLGFGLRGLGFGFRGSGVQALRPSAKLLCPRGLGRLAAVKLASGLGRVLQLRALSPKQTIESKPEESPYKAQTPP